MARTDQGQVEQGISVDQTHNLQDLKKVRTNSFAMSINCNHEEKKIQNT